MSKSRTVLLFGELSEEGVPQSALAHFGSEAYEHYMVAPYVRELMMVRNTSYVCWSPCFDVLYAAILAVKAETVQFVELGSTLFSTIDKFDKLHESHRSVAQQPEINYVGIEVSPLLIDLASALHPGRKLNHYSTWQQIPPSSIDMISRSYMSTSYAFQETDELFEWMSRSKLGIHGVWWCIDGGQRLLAMAGNRAALFDPERFSQLAEEHGFSISVLKSEVYQYREVKYSASWIMMSRLLPDEAMGLEAVAAKMKIAPALPVCALSKAGLAAQPFVGLHAGFLPIHSSRAFDFNDNQLQAQWEHYSRGN